jgi:hypothetical protein
VAGPSSWTDLPAVARDHLLATGRDPSERSEQVAVPDAVGSVHLGR